MLSSSWLKLPDLSVLKSSSKGSFDCVAVRLANVNSAQDDTLIRHK